MAVAFAAADTYVVVLALPDMMASVGIPVDQLQRAAPIVSGFLLGYVAMLPLIGRIADLRGRVPVLVAALLVFALGSLVTALAYDMPTHGHRPVPPGRRRRRPGARRRSPWSPTSTPPSAAACRSAWSPPSRSSAACSARSSAPLVLAVADWRAIFLINLAVGLVLAAAIRRCARTVVEARPRERAEPRTGRFDWLGLALALVTLVAGVLVFVQPSQLMRDLTYGQLFIPVTGDGRWLTPLGLTAIGAFVLLVVRCCTARRPLLDIRDWVAHRARGRRGRRAAAGAGAGRRDPGVRHRRPQGAGLLRPGALVPPRRRARRRRLRRCTCAGPTDPLVPTGALRRTPAWGAMLVSFFIGAALIAALIDIPLFARTTVYPDSQLMAALVLVRFLVALPVGAVLGGYLTHRLPAGVVTAAGMALRRRRLPLDGDLGAGVAWTARSPRCRW